MEETQPAKIKPSPFFAHEPSYAQKKHASQVVEERGLDLAERFMRALEAALRFGPMGRHIPNEDHAQHAARHYTTMSTRTAARPNPDSNGVCGYVAVTKSRDQITLRTFEAQWFRRRAADRGVYEPSYILLECFEHQLPIDGRLPFNHQRFRIQPAVWASQPEDIDPVEFAATLAVKVTLYLQGQPFAPFAEYPPVDVMLKQDNWLTR